MTGLLDMDTDGNVVRSDESDYYDGMNPLELMAQRGLEGTPG